MSFCLQLVGASLKYGTPSSSPDRELGILVDLEIPITTRGDVVEEIQGVWDEFVEPKDLHFPGYTMRGLIRTVMDFKALVDEGLIESANVFESSTVERSLEVIAPLKSVTERTVSLQFPRVKMWFEGRVRLQEIEGLQLEFLPMRALHWDGVTLTTVKIEVS